MGVGCSEVALWVGCALMGLTMSQGLWQLQGLAMRSACSETSLCWYRGSDELGCWL